MLPNQLGEDEEQVARRTDIEAPTYEANITRREALEQRLKDLRVQKDIRRLEQEVADAEEESRQGSYVQATSETAPTELRSLRHGRTDSGEQMTRDPRPFKRVQFKTPAEYKGDSTSALHKYLEQCEILFELEPSRYESSSSRILFARQYLDGLPREDWTRYIETNKQPTWAEYRTVVATSLGDPASRKQKAYRKWMDAKQQHYQSALQFLEHLKSLLPELDEEIRRPDTIRMRFELGLKEGTREWLAVLPPNNKLTVDEIASYLTQNEKNSQVGPRPVSKNRTEERRMEDNRRGPKQTTATSGHTQTFKLDDDEYARRRKLGICFQCGTVGHRVRDCPQRRDNPNTLELGSGSGKG